MGTISAYPFGVRLPEKYIKHWQKDTLTYDMISKEPNVEVRRALSLLANIESQLSPPLMVDETGSIHELPGGSRVLRLVCPSSGRVYLHHTQKDNDPPSTHRARRWNQCLCPVCRDVLSMTETHPNQDNLSKACEFCGTNTEVLRVFKLDFNPTQDT